MPERPSMRTHALSPHAMSRPPAGPMDFLLMLAMPSSSHEADQEPMDEGS